MTDFHRVQEIRGNLNFLADRITREHFNRFPDLAKKYGESGRRRCNEDAAFHLSFLAAAADAGLEVIFTDYVAWAKTVLVARRVPESDLVENMRTVSSVLASHFGAEDAAPLVAMMDRAIAALPEMPSDVPSFIDSSTPVGQLAQRYVELLVQGDEAGANREVAAALDRGMKLFDVCSTVFQMVQQEVGRLWQLNEISIATEHFCTAVAQRTLAGVCGMRVAQPGAMRKRLAAVCAPEELHDFGLRAITDLLALEGWQTYFLGANVPATAVPQTCADRNADVLLISASLPPRIATVTEVVRLVREHPKLRDVKIIVGGRAFASSPEVWRVTGADAFATDAATIVGLLR